MAAKSEASKYRMRHDQGKKDKRQKSDSRKPSSFYVQPDEDEGAMKQWVRILTSQKMIPTVL